MFDRSRQFQVAWKHLEDRLVEEQKKVMKDFEKKGQEAVDRVNALCDALEKKYPELKDEEGSKK